VRIVERVRVTGFTHRRHADQLWITGVLTDSPYPSLSSIPADLVVDATGRGTKTPKWLSELGLPPPVELRVDANCNYATRHYRAPAEAKSWWWRTLLIDQRPPDHARGCAIFTVEGECWIVTAIGTNGDFAPSDEAGWLNFLKSLRSPVAHDLVRRAEPLGDIVQSRTTVNRWKRMHEYDAKLGGLLLFGDAVCGFNPSYGQGITASLLAARALAEMMPVHAGPIDHAFLRRYYEAQAGFLKAGWTLSTNMDFRWPTTTGKRPMFYPLVRKAAALLERIAVHDPELLRALIPLADFGASPWSVMGPSLCARIVRGLARHVIARPALAAEVDLFSSATNASASEPRSFSDDAFI